MRKLPMNPITAVVTGCSPPKMASGTTPTTSKKGKAANTKTSTYPHKISKHRTPFHFCPLPIVMKNTLPFLHFFRKRKAHRMDVLYFLHRVFIFLVRSA